MPGAVDRVLARVAEGKTVAAIAEELGVTALSVQNVLFEPHRAKAVTEARKAGAAALVEQTLAIAEGDLPTIDPRTGEPAPDVARDKLRIQSRQWLAERRDRATWGNAQQAVTINIAGLHLDALRARPAPVEAVDTIYIEHSNASRETPIGEDYANHPLFG